MRATLGLAAELKNKSRVWFSPDDEKEIDRGTVFLTTKKISSRRLEFLSNESEANDLNAVASEFVRIHASVGNGEFGTGDGPGVCGVT